MIKLTKSDFEKILAHAVKELPDEACGLIAGTVEDGDKEIKRFIFLQISTTQTNIFRLIQKNSLRQSKI